ncbi:UDP-4-amino-4,6-dideoxy-N-acetyl-beta-L-altrosamine transaminase [Polynucleobacter sp. UB-Tiil-W10]|uniref:UDP-4-amino-4, 6-dideoxy-N-acetyl-beta-L-altrosamine transaminase n=1 Tax=Polynucleobacter sp. UB-Tiil-W10 TaxID=1855648 RepID=UPI001C0CE90B|nr:UDP-4-amino-4,6-dideoxy-N-acetyl-beta-L-altrosamine transaminase [Polynucleobacter sp. UB-Tiil-W10]MBU3540795.1 UDP-4-amino-4,6-dideoxy-N-acetyl-beta-L-altrosamine transaminase [Polynucleobacter sp. UB-Tiil-W10]
MTKLIPYGRQDINEADIQAVIDVLKSDFLTQGPAVPAFEVAVRDFVGAKHAIATSNATSALHLACLALGVGPGDIVWTSPITFVASANCAVYCGAKVDFVDVDLDSFNMSEQALRCKLEHARKARLLPKVLIPVHMGGQSCNMAAFYDLSKEYGFSIIEDASHAIGGRYQNQQVGSCQFSSITVFSFHPVKIITTGEGGMAITNDLGLAKKMQLLRSHGITREQSEMVSIPDGPWFYEQIDLGFNYRMTDIQAALGLSQMSRLHDFVIKRNSIAHRYEKLLKDVPVFLPKIAKDTYSAYHLYVIQLNLELISSSHKNVFNELRNAGIGVNLHYIPVYLQPYYQNLGFSKGYCPNAEKYYSRAISLPMFSSLTDEEQDWVVTQLIKAIQK